MNPPPEPRDAFAEIDEIAATVRILMTQIKGSFEIQGRLNEGLNQNMIECFNVIAALEARIAALEGGYRLIVP